MCTALSIFDREHLFGRTLDYERDFGEQVVVTPRGTPVGRKAISYGIIGIAVVVGGEPLYFDGMNERGLCVAALNYPEYAVYQRPSDKKLNVPSFRLSSFILGNCSSAKEARAVLENICVTDEAISEEMPPSPLHWLIADRETAFCAEPEEDGLILRDDAVGVMTNAPGLEYHLTRLRDFMGLSCYAPENKLCSAELRPYSRGMGAIGLPGDHSSSSRFVRAVFARESTLCEGSEVGRFFHITDILSIPSGGVIAENRQPVKTVYTSLARASDMTYYFTTYNCRRIRAVRFLPELNERGRGISLFPMRSDEDILYIDEKRAGRCNKA